jgi:hypothetical protein
MYLAYKVARGLHDRRILMPLYHGIGSGRVLSMVYMKVGTTDPYCFYSQEDLVVPRRPGFRNLPEFYFTG